MASEHEVACVHYKWEGECAKGRDGIFRKTCQTCNKYIARKGGVPARKDLKRQKLEKIKERDMRRDIKNY